MLKYSHIQVYRPNKDIYILGLFLKHRISFTIMMALFAEDLMINVLIL